MGNRNNKSTHQENKQTHQVDPPKKGDKFATWWKKFSTQETKHVETKHVESEVDPISRRKDVLLAHQEAQIQEEKHIPSTQPTTSAERLANYQLEALLKQGYISSQRSTSLAERPTSYQSETLQKQGYISSQRSTSLAKRPTSYQSETLQKQGYISSQQPTSFSERPMFDQQEIIKNRISDQSKREILTAATTTKITLGNHKGQNKYLLGETVSDQEHLLPGQDWSSYEEYLSYLLGRTFSVEEQTLPQDQSDKISSVKQVQTKSGKTLSAQEQALPQQDQSYKISSVKQVQTKSGKTPVRQHSLCQQRSLNITLNPKTVEYQLDLSGLQKAYHENNDCEYESGTQLSLHCGGDNLSTKLSCFPYRPDLCGVRFQEVIERHDSKDPLGRSINANISMINLDSTVYMHKIIMNIKEEYELYFHGTDAVSAQNILNNGINLKKTKERLDFSYKYGFYVTSTFTKAIKWANRKSKKFSNRAAAVIVFKINKTLQKEMPHLCLGVKTSAEKKKWNSVISHFRNGENNSHVASMLTGMKFIEGPVNRIACLRNGKRPIPDDSYIQICICDGDYAYRYGSLSNICLVIFFQNY